MPVCRRSCRWSPVAPILATVAFHFVSLLKFPRRIAAPFGPVNTSALENLGREVFEVYCDDYLCTCFYRCGQYMSVVRVGKIERFDQWLVVEDQTVSYCAVHQLPCTAQTLHVDIRMTSCDAAKGLVQDRVCPFGLDQTTLRDPDQEISQCVRKQNIRVVHHNKWHCASSFPSPVSERTARQQPPRDGRCRRACSCEVTPL